MQTGKTPLERNLLTGYVDYFCILREKKHLPEPQFLPVIDAQLATYVLRNKENGLGIELAFEPRANFDAFPGKLSPIAADLSKGFRLAVYHPSMLNSTGEKSAQLYGVHFAPQANAVEQLHFTAPAGALLDAHLQIKRELVRSNDAAPHMDILIDQAFRMWRLPRKSFDHIQQYHFS